MPKTNELPAGWLPQTGQDASKTIAQQILEANRSYERQLEEERAQIGRGKPR